MSAARWNLQRERALVRDDGRCQASAFGVMSACRAFPPGPVVHHRRRRKGQPDVHALEWLVTLCGFHHDWVHANVAESYSNGLLVRASIESETAA